MVLALALSVPALSSAQSDHNRAPAPSRSLVVEAAGIEDDITPKAPANGGDGIAVTGGRSAGAEPQPLADPERDLLDKLAAQDQSGDSTGGKADDGPTAGREDATGGRSTGGVPYTYWDGDEQRTVWLEDPPTGNGGRSALEGSDGAGGGELVFRSRSGEEMSLPGGVIVVLNPRWSPAQTDAFFARNKIERGRVTELGWIDNGFLIDTSPGLAALDLANSLYGQTGVEMSTPDWATEPVLK